MLIRTSIRSAPIETLQVGQRVLTSLSDGEVGDTEVTSDWQVIDLELGDAEGQVLRPPEWLPYVGESELCVHNTCGRLQGLADEIRRARSVEARSRRTIAVGADSREVAASSNAVIVNRAKLRTLYVHAEYPREEAHTWRKTWEVPSLSVVGTSRPHPVAKRAQLCCTIEFRQVGIDNR